MVRAQLRQRARGSRRAAAVTQPRVSAAAVRRVRLAGREETAKFIIGTNKLPQTFKLETTSWERETETVLQTFAECRMLTKKRPDMNEHMSEDICIEAVHS